MSNETEIVILAIIASAFFLSQMLKKPKKMPTEGADWVWDNLTQSYNPTISTYQRIPAWELAAEQVLRWYQGGNATVGDILQIRSQFSQDPNVMFDKLFPGFQRILPTLRRSDYIDDTGFPSMALLKAAWPRILRVHADDRRESWDPVPDWDADEASD